MSHGRLHLLAAAVVLLATAACNPSTADRRAEPDGSNQERVLTIADRERTYRLHVSRGSDGKRPLPLVIAMHGRGQTGAALAAGVGYDALADKEGFLVAYPQGWKREWNTRLPARVTTVPDDVAFLAAVVDDVARAHPVDRRRVYATGHSDGGRMALRLGCERSDVFAAVAPMAGGLTVGCRPSRPVAVLQVQGAADTLTSQEAAGAVLELRKVNGCSATVVAQRVGTASVRRYACRAGVEVSSVIVPDLPHHVWSTAQTGYDATTESWKFFQRFALPSGPTDRPT